MTTDVSTDARAVASAKAAAPADVPSDQVATYEANWTAATRGTGRLVLFAGDQKVEHLNDDFAGDTKVGPIAEEDGEPEHLFRIASQGAVGCFASQLGIVARYGLDYRDVPYLVKLNSKTPLLKTPEHDPQSRQWNTVEQAVALRGRGLNIIGIGFTIYPGSAFESEQYAEAARACYEAHREGLIAVLWSYPRGASVPDEKDPHLLAGAAGVGAALGADFVKVNYPRSGSAEDFVESVRAAGRSGVITAGGESVDVRAFLQTLFDQVNVAGARGSATGRNIHQKPLAEAVRMTRAISAVTYGGYSVDEAMEIYEGAREYEAPAR